MINSECLVKADYFNKLYPNGLDLSDSFISAVDFLYDGPAILIHFHTINLPVDRPVKWDVEDNMIKVTLEFIEIEDLNFTKWGTQNRIKFKLSKQNDNYSITINGDDMDISFKCSFINFKSISSYLF